MNAPRPNLPAVHLVQLGARRDYELLRFINAHTRLVQFSTSTAWGPDGTDSFPLRVVQRYRPGLVRRRTIPALNQGNLLSVPVVDLAAGIATSLGLRPMMRRAFANWVLGRAVLRSGWSSANVLFTVDGNGGFAMLEAARDEGLTIVADIVVTPKAYAKMQAEDRLWPGFADRHIRDTDVQRFEEHYRRLAALCDLMICPSNTVVEGIAKVAPGTEGRCVCIPYGLSGHEVRSGNSIPGRVLFAGGDATRKGLPYLGQAAARLKQQGCEAQVVVAGRFSANVRGQPECRELTFLGHLDHGAMMQEFAQADVFCLPTLAEGSASVILEALAAGVPVIVTRSAGSTVTDGIQGRIVPERDSEALAIAIRDLVEDRDRRAAMSIEALALAETHESDKIGPRIAQAIAGAVKSVGDQGKKQKSSETPKT